jgi:hypothetical protein
VRHHEAMVDIVAVTVGRFVVRFAKRTSAMIKGQE